jgi:hypothetical protein
MGGTHTWIWAQKYPGFMDVAVPMASLPAEMSGRNWMLRRLIIDSIRFLGPDIALEKGIAKVTLPKGDSTAARYSVVHARREGKWVMVVGHDAPYVSSLDDDYLKDLAWLIGDWKSDSKDQSVRVKYEWMAQRNFIKNTYLLTKDGKSTLTGGQIIGWDPKAGRIVSWHFDAEGGFGHDTWTKDGSKWLVRAAGTLRDSSDSTAVNVFTPIDANSFTWQSTDRTLDGVGLPDVLIDYLPSLVSKSLTGEAEGGTIAGISADGSKILFGSFGRNLTTIRF